MVNDMDECINSLVTVPGFPCIHRRQKLYIEPDLKEKLDTWILLYAKYVQFVGTDPDIRKMSYKSFFRLIIF